MGKDMRREWKRRRFRIKYARDGAKNMQAGEEGGSAGAGRVVAYNGETHREWSECWH